MNDTTPNDTRPAKTDAPDMPGTHGSVMSGDTVKRAVRQLVTLGKIDDDAADQIVWFYGYGRDNGWSLRGYADALDKTTSTVHRLFSASYGASYDNIIDDIRKYRRFATERAKKHDIGFVETSTWRKIDEVCRAALYDSMPAFIFGESQTGKTTALKEFARRNNHGTTKYVRMPSAPTLGYFIEIVAMACHIAVRSHGAARLRERIFAAVDNRTLVIVDEVHQALITRRDASAIAILEFLRELYDRTECGIVLCGTAVFRNELESGRHSLIFDQFRRRGMIKLVLPATPGKADINKIAKAFGLPPPEADILAAIRHMLKISGLGMYVRYLQAAHKLADANKTTLTWDHFTQVWDSLRKLEEGRE